MSDEPSRRIRLGLLFGGRSPEHEVSIISARSVRQALDPARFEVLPMAIGRDGRWLAAADSAHLLADTAGTHEDAGPRGGALVPAETLTGAVDVIFPLLHGPFGEDGTVQGLLELLGVPYVGAGVAASAVGMDKALMKALFLHADLPVLPYALVHDHAWRADRAAVLQRLALKPGFPCFVKPANMGSSVGISRVDAAAELAPALELAFSYDMKVLVEHGVPGYREIECAVLGNEEPAVSLPGEIRIEGRFYDYRTKYTDGAAGLQAPVEVRPETARALQRLSLGAFAAIDAAGMARVDFLVAPDESEIWLNEINTIPGFTPFSMYPLLWQASGLPYPELIARLVELAIDRHDRRAVLHRDRLPEG